MMFKTINKQVGHQIQVRLVWDFFRYVGEEKRTEIFYFYLKKSWFVPFANMTHFGPKSSIPDIQVLTHSQQVDDQVSSLERVEGRVCGTGQSCTSPYIQQNTDDSQDIETRQEDIHDGRMSSGSSGTGSVECVSFQLSTVDKQQSPIINRECLLMTLLVKFLTPLSLCDFLCDHKVKEVTC